MKFEKFAKSLAAKGTIYESQMTTADWLASPTACMKLPAGIQSVTAAGVNAMPKMVDDIIGHIGHTIPAMLVDAVMTTADGGIKDCVRVFESEDGKTRVGISNENWVLLDKSDMVEIHYIYDLEDDTMTPNALVVKQYPKTPGDDIDMVGVILPVEY